MPKFAIVVDNADVAHTQAIHRNIEKFRAAGFPPEFAVSAARAYVGDAHPEGFVINAEPLATECPEGKPNCRNCGDPAHEDTCRAAGHCPNCGRSHGMASDATLAKHGYRLEPR